MDITKRLLNLDPTLSLHNEGEWSNTQSLYNAFNDAGVECEVGEFLYSMVRITKPKYVLETGTHWGIGASYMGLGLKDNGFGKLITIEYLPEIRNVALERIKRIGISDFVESLLENAITYIPPADMRFDLALFDTEPQTRFHELIRNYEYMNPGSFMFIHDLHPHMQQIDNEEHGYAWPFGVMPGMINQQVRLGSLRPFHFRTPRGLTGFYKVAEDDYKFPLKEEVRKYAGKKSKGRL